MVKEALVEARGRYTESANENRKTTEKKFMVGELVLKQIDWQKKESAHKFGKKWNGPYQVISVQRPNLILKELAAEAKPFKVHMDKLKHFNEPYVIPLREMASALTENPLDPDPSTEDANDDNTYEETLEP